VIVTPLNALKTPEVPEILLPVMVAPLKRVEKLPLTALTVAPVKVVAVTVTPLMLVPWIVAPVIVIPLMVPVTVALFWTIKPLTEAWLLTVKPEVVVRSVTLRFPLIDVSPLMVPHRSKILLASKKQ
jgi:hypothetical protein